MPLRSLTIIGVMSVACSEPAPRIVASSAHADSSSAAPPVTSVDPTAIHRERLVFEIVKRGGPWPGASWDPRVLATMRSVRRHAFVPDLSLSDAYADTPQPIGLGQTISQPTVVAVMAQALELHEKATVLEIGTGSGYNAAVLAELAGQVYTIELHEPLARSAREKLRALGYENVTVRHGDGYAGWKEHAPFDRIVLTAAPPDLPPALVEQLAEGGVLVAPVGPEGETQRLMRYRKKGGELEAEDLGRVMFVPMVPGAR